MKMRIHLLFLFSIVCGIHAGAQNDTVYRFSLNEAMNYALEHNYDVRNAELDIQSAKKEVWATTAIGLPQVSGTGDYQHVPGEIPTFDFGSGFMPILNKLEELHPGEFQPIMQGLSEAESPIAVRNTVTYGFTVSQLIFSGEYIVGLQASRTFLELSKNAVDKTEDNTKSAVATSYYSVLVLQENMDILDSTLVNMSKLIDETGAMVENGFLEETELDQLQLSYNTMENSRKAMERQLEISYRLFKLQLGIDHDNDVELTQSLNEVMTDSDKEVVNQPFSLEDNVDYQLLQTQEKIQELSLKREKSKLLPSLSGFYSYTDKTNRPDFDFTINHMLGVSLSVPVFSSGQRLARVQQAGIELDKAKNNTRRTEESLYMAVAEARSEYRNALDTYTTEQENIELTKKIYQRTLIKYKEGMASSLELTQVNNQYLNANTQYLNAVLNLLNAEISLEQALNLL